MALRTTALFLIASCLSLPASAADDSQSIVERDYSCPPGFIPLPNQGANYNPSCAVDRCYGTPGPCGEGNQCTSKKSTVSGISTFESVCTCSAPSVLAHIVYTDFCYVPGTDRCNPNPCKNGGTCEAVADFISGEKRAFVCTCPQNFQGVTCDQPSENPAPTRRNGTSPPTLPPTPPPTTGPPIIIDGNQGLCGPGELAEAAPFPQRCWFNNDPQGRYVCCDAQGCDGFNADNLTPHCKNFGYVPPNFGKSGGPSPPPEGDQGVCGKTGAEPFPNRCWFNNDPLGRYVCCDNQGCDGFNADNLTPHCKNFGYVPDNFGRTSPPGPGPTGNGGPQGVCGLGAASAFPNRCWYNNDPQGRYVCCDNDGCNGFYQPGNLFPRCKTNGFVPPSL
ncbi:hypothetical protein KFL_000620310 [Klebsormidium nitens]|uniref:EGF-like domain-containing protein n=1 Tax=Klebsormidium nitens TaxID=105231 RepID=A0A1Y1HWA2_KLENI|nr:hypothetical protein KFL_000620310 [Klebsormidium nitens]|eukprot:GAQ80797.1 hypothetical protein KFL_000620310 [Klebsormidium nitens]